MTSIPENKTGLGVIYFDSNSRPHHALITADWYKGNFGAVNLIYVHDDPNRTDQYGQQIERPTSVAHISNANYSVIMGNCWCTIQEYEETYSKKTPQRP